MLKIFNLFLVASLLTFKIIIRIFQVPAFLITWFAALSKNYFTLLYSVHHIKCTFILLAPGQSPVSHPAVQKTLSQFKHSPP